MKTRILWTCTMMVLFFACKKELQSPESAKSTSEEVEVKAAPESKEATSSLFLAKKELDMLDEYKIHYSKGREVLLFRPSENDFGLLLEDTQDKTWLLVDDQFEELSKTLQASFNKNNELVFSVVEKPMIGVVRTADTLFFDAAQKHYGLILCSPDKTPIFLAHDADNMVEVIKSQYTLE